MRQEVPVDLKEKLFEALKKSMNDCQASTVPANAVAPEEQTPRSEFEKLTRQVLALNTAYPEIPALSVPEEAGAGTELDMLFAAANGENARENEIWASLLERKLKEPAPEPTQTPVKSHGSGAVPVGKAEAPLAPQASDSGLFEGIPDEFGFEDIPLDGELKAASERLMRQLESELPDAQEGAIGEAAEGALYGFSKINDFTAFYRQMEQDAQAAPPQKKASAPERPRWASRSERTSPQQSLSASEHRKPPVELSSGNHSKKEFDGTLSLEDSGVGQVQSQAAHDNPVSDSPSKPLPERPRPVADQSPGQLQNQQLQESRFTGGRMADLSGYKDLSRAPLASGEEKQDKATAVLTASSSSLSTHTSSFDRVPSLAAEAFSEMSPEVDTEFSGNVQTLIRLVNELPDGVTKQTGAQIIRLTMEAMGISMEDVLSDAQAAQSEMLDAVRANIKKIEEYKTVIRKLETDIKYYQGKANELSEIIDLFILSNTSTKVPTVDDLSHH